MKLGRRVGHSDDVSWVVNNQRKIGSFPASFSLAWGVLQLQLQYVPDSGLLLILFRPCLSWGHFWPWSFHCWRNFFTLSKAEHYKLSLVKDCVCACVCVCFPILRCISFLHGLTITETRSWNQGTWEPGSHCKLCMACRQSLTSLFCRCSTSVAATIMWHPPCVTVSSLGFLCVCLCSVSPPSKDSNCIGLEHSLMTSF